MLAKLRPRLTYANVMSTIAVFVALSTGAYAANTIGSDDVIDESLLSQDIKNGQVKSVDLGDAEVTNAKLAANSVTAPKVADFGLTNEDIGVLFAEVRSNATLSKVSGPGVTVRMVGGLPGNAEYEVDFGRDIHRCTAVATLSKPNDNGFSGEIFLRDGIANDEAVLVHTRNSAGERLDAPFRVVVVC
jgi:hypothetical protein